MLDQARVQRYLETIYTSFVTSLDPEWIVARSRQQIEDGEGSDEWREASALAIARFEQAHAVRLS